MSVMSTASVTRGLENPSLKGPGVALVIVFLALVLSGLSVVWTSHRVRTLTADLEVLQGRQDALLEERGRLLLEHSAFAGLTRVEALATEELDMKIPRQADMEFVYER